MLFSSMREDITIAPADTTRPRLMRSHHRIWQSSSAPLQPVPQRWNGWKNQENTTENRWPRWKSAAASCARKVLGYMKGPKNSVRKPPKGAKKQERKTVNLPRLRWYAYLSPLRFWAMLLPSNLLTSNQKKSGSERPVSLDKTAQQKREDDLSSRFQHIEWLISSYISRVPRWKGPSPCRSRCGQSFRGA